MSAEDPYAVAHNHSDTNLYLRGVPASVDDATLRSFFEPFGEVISAMVMRDIHTGESMGTAFVRFTTHPSALAAMKHFYPNPSATFRSAAKTASGGSHHPAPSAESVNSAVKAPIPGLVIQWARKQHDEALVGEARMAARKLFLRNIPQDVDGKTLFELVKPYGLVDQVTLHVDTADAGNTAAGGNGGFMALSAKSSSCSGGADAAPPALITSGPLEPRLIAFVTFSNDGAAAAACDALHNTTPFRNHGGVPIMAKLAEDSRQRSARRSGGHAAGASAGGPRGSGGPRPSLCATSTAHSNRSGQQSGFSSYHYQIQGRPAGFSTFQEVETTIYPSPMQSVAYSQHQPLHAARTDVYNKAAPISANQQYYTEGGPVLGGRAYSAHMVVPPRPPTVPLSAHTMQNYYPTLGGAVSPSQLTRTGAVSPQGLGRLPSSLTDLDTLSQAQCSHYDASNGDTASSNSRFRYNPYNAIDPQTIL